MNERHFHVYIVASRSHTLYIGVTSAIEKRMWRHKAGILEGFSRSYNCNRLVYFETYSDVLRAIAREKQLKRWSRAKKITLIERTNATWHDLSETWGESSTPQRASVDPATRTPDLFSAFRSGQDDSQ